MIGRVERDKINARCRGQIGRGVGGIGHAKPAAIEQKLRREILVNRKIGRRMSLGKCGRQLRP